MSFLVLQRGSILFFCRPKVQYTEVHNLEDVQHFFVVLKPEKKKHFIFIVIGRKRLPENEPYFGFVEKIAKSEHQAIRFISEEHYITLTKGERDVAAANCIGIGQYLLMDHEQHTHLVYKLSKPFRLGNTQKEFHLKKQEDYLISVKNPIEPSPHGVGLSHKQKAQYPDKLQNLFQNYRFISLDPVEFLEYEGTELLLIGQTSSNFKKKNKEILLELNKIKEEKTLAHFECYLRS